MRKILFTIVVSLFVIATQLLADATQPLNFTAVNGPATISLDSIGTPYTISLQYSTDNCMTWNNYPIGQEVQLASGETVFFNATSTNSKFSKANLEYNSAIRDYFRTDYYIFSMAGAVSANGNIMSLIDATMQQVSVPDSAFVRLFYECDSLTTAPSIPATTLGVCCYMSMFENCSSLKTSPALPATTLAASCYCDMFSGCTSLVTSSSLPATTLAQGCYSCMFYDCESLTIAPALPAIILTEMCYEAMFVNCKMLKSAPELPATTLAEYCYKQMFWGCTSLVSIPKLNAEIVLEDCYMYMFANCTSLIVNESAPGKPWQIPANVDSVGPYTGWNMDMFEGTGGNFTGNPEPGVTYYIASDTTTTAVEQVTDDVDITLFPNPIHIGEPAYINTTDDIQTVEIYNTDGKCVQSIIPTTSPIRIDNLNAAGIYIIRLTTKNNASTTRKLIVQ